MTENQQGHQASRPHSPEEEGEVQTDKGTIHGHPISGNASPSCGLDPVPRLSFCKC